MNVQEATAALTPDLRPEVNWFAEPGQKQFVDPISLGVIAMGLIKLFVTAAVTAAGAKTGEAAVEYVRDLIAGRKKLDAKDVDAATAAAREQLAKTPPQEVNAKLLQAQSALGDQFAVVMPRARATTLAERVHAAAALLRPAAAA